MTIEQLLDLPADGLISLTDKQIIEMFEPYKHIIRPELAEKPEKHKRIPNAQLIKKSAARQKALEIAARMGITDLKL